MEGIFLAGQEWERLTDGEVSFQFEVVDEYHDDWYIHLEDIPAYGRTFGTRIRLDTRDIMDKDLVYKTMLHEFGHSLHLDHVEIPDSTMYWRINAWTVTKDVLENFNEIDCGE